MGETNGKPAGSPSALTARAVLVPGWSDGPDLVHLALRMGSEPEAWSTACPANVAGLPLQSDMWRSLVPVFEPINCPACIAADPYGDVVDSVNLMSRVLEHRRVQASVQVSAFLRYVRDKLGMTLADRPDGVHLKAYPSGFDESIIVQWLTARPPTS